jgi:hypothetical protein
MKSHMDLEASCSGVSFIATMNLTNKWFLTSMSKLMCL